MPAVVPFHPSLLESNLLVDARTPAEYAEDHLPGAINVPTLNDAERAEIGTIYKQQGPHPARERGLALVAPRLPEMVREISIAACGRPILVYCWRGGLRSRSIAAVLKLTGFEAAQLEGGYKAFRHRVTEYFEAFRHPKPLVVIHGMTGIGKTAFLSGLKERGFAVVDLEGLACHRGSAFGQLGLNQELNQKRFDTLLWDAIRQVPEGLPIVVEGESQRIGRVSLPGDFYEKMGAGIRVWCHAPLSVRVQRLLEEYDLPAYKEEMAAALFRIKKKLGEKAYQRLSEHLERWELEPFTRGLIEDYYDRVYYKNRSWQEELTLSLEDYREAEDRLEQYLSGRLGSPVRA